MKHALFAICATLFLLIPIEPSWAAPNPQAGGPRLALVIGNSAYKSAPLVNPVNDARAVSDALRKLGFKVIALENASHKQMHDAVRSFGDQLQGSVGLFYYAGHGVQVKGRNFLLPVDTHIEREDEVEFKAFDVGQVLAKMESAKNPLNIVILDACRNNPFARSSRSGTVGLAQMDAPTGSIVAFATAPGAEAADGSSGNGLYTSHLLKNLNTPGLKVEDVFKRTRVAVKQGSNGRQIPWESTSLEGDFYFAPGSGASAPTRQPADLDKEMWELVLATGQPSAYRAYLDRFPEGQFAGQARSLVAQQAAPASPSPTAPPAPSQGQSEKAPATEPKPGKFSFSAEEAKLDKATPAGRELAFERLLAELKCPEGRRRASVRLMIQEPDGGLFSSTLAQRLGRAGLRVGTQGDLVIHGTVSHRANPHRLLRVNEITVNAAIQMSTASGRSLVQVVNREESYTGGDPSLVYQELTNAQASTVASDLVREWCRVSI